MITAFKNIDPYEKRVMTFHFVDGLDPGETIVSAFVVITVLEGTDANAAAHFSSATISGTDVLVAVAGQLIDVMYLIETVAQTSNPAKALVIARTLLCAVGD